VLLDPPTQDDAGPRTLTPTQRSRVEKLQRTLSNDEPDASSDIVTKVAI
jgi:hypothetical protein